MNIAAIEFNDQALLIQADDGTVLLEPGFARLTATGIETGESAHALAWREPQHNYNQYWCHLNQAPLAAREKWARHHCDIAFAQLRHLWDGAGRADELVLLVPGSFSDEQLSLLLGMVEALPASSRAIIDSALAACLDITRETIHVDLQLHQTVLSLCRPDGPALEVVEHEVIPTLGLMQVHNSIARRISNLLIDSFRYDPLHASGTEQAIYDQAPAWLTRLSWDREVSASLSTDKGELPFNLDRQSVAELVTERLAAVHSFIGRHAGADLRLSHPSAVLNGLVQAFEGAGISAQAAGAEHILGQYHGLLEQADDLYRVTRLQRADAPHESTPGRGARATHLLYGDRALPLHRPVSIRVGEDGLQVDSAMDEAADLTLVLRQQSLETVHRLNGVEASVPRECTPGALVTVAGHQLRLIEVRDG